MFKNFPSISKINIRAESGIKGDGIISHVKAVFGSTKSSSITYFRTHIYTNK